ncbi:hypothetical protein [Microcystis aeruginosa]|uniref:hypothetical protein n=1 Tax=Microcystis aeruginosa TaxID=1126 RepID=UPI00187F4AE9|nr:hypothetical protein [Microcystis aeruginosa]
MNKNYNIWELHCTPKSVIPYSKISGARTDPKREAQEIRQMAVENLQAEKIEIGDIKQAVNTYNYLGNEDSSFTHLSPESLLQSLVDFPELSLDIKRIIGLLYQNHVLVLGGEFDDKFYFARYLAKEIYHQINLDDVKVFLIYTISPQNISSDLSKLRESAQTNFVIATTDYPKSRWAGIGLDNYWWQPEREEIYTPESLVNSLYNKLHFNTKLLLSLVINESPLSELTNKDVIGIKEYLHAQLGNKKIVTFAGINNCARILNQLDINEQINQEKLTEIFALANNQRESLKKWYNTYLSSREQLLAISLSLFDGLFEDQFFAALEKIVEDVWQKRDASLQALDYSDLINLSNHFEFTDFIVETDQLDGFKFVQTQDIENQLVLRQIALNRSNERRLLFEVAWDSHRRQILTTLPTLVNFIKESVQSNLSNWELSGGSVRRNQLHNAIIETISDLGLVSKNTTGKVQNALLELAAQREIAIQDVAARAIKRWYQYGGEQELFKTLQQFYFLTISKQKELIDNTKNSNAQPIKKQQKFILVLLDFIVNIFLELFKSLSGDSATKKPELISKYSDYLGNTNFIQSIQNLEELIFKNCLSTSEIILRLSSIYRCNYLEENKQNFEKIREDCIGSTIALAVGYTARDDHQNSSCLRAEFLDWLKELSESRFPLVHVYLGYHTLFYLVPLYLEQLKDWLKEVTQKHIDVLNHAIALSLANAYNLPGNRATICQLLNEWEQESSPSSEWEKTLRKQEALQKTVVLTYGLIEYPNNDELTVNQALNRLGKILNNQPSLLVRAAVISAICNLAFRYFNIIEFELQNLVANFRANEAEKFIKILTDIYLKQRANLSGGNDEIKVNERSYQIWTDSERPLTEIEKAMYRWIRRMEPEVPQNQVREPEHKTAAQKVALAAFTSFAVNLDQEEERLIQKLKGETNHAES